MHGPGDIHAYGYIKDAYWPDNDILDVDYDSEDDIDQIDAMKAQTCTSMYITHIKPIEMLIVCIDDEEIPKLIPL